MLKLDTEYGDRWQVRHCDEADGCAVVVSIKKNGPGRVLHIPADVLPSVIEELQEIAKRGEA